MTTIAMAYAWASAALVVVAVFRGPHHRVILMLVLCYALGRAVAAAVDNGSDSSIWLLVMFGWIVVFPAGDLLLGEIAKRRDRIGHR